MLQNFSLLAHHCWLFFKAISMRAGYIVFIIIFQKFFFPVSFSYLPEVSSAAASASSHWSSPGRAAASAVPLELDGLLVVLLVVLLVLLASPATASMVVATSASVTKHKKHRIKTTSKQRKS